MTTSSTYTWSPEIVEVADECFERVGIDPANLSARHMRAFRRSLEYLLASWANMGVPLWAVDQVTVTLTQGTATYATPVGTTAILEMILRRTVSSTAIDVNIFPMTRDEYLAIPSKTQQGFPSRYYFNRTHTTASVPVVTGAYGPTITLWTTPMNSTDQMIYYRFRRLQDAGVGTNTVDIPYRWQEALAAGAAARMAQKFVPDRLQELRADAATTFMQAKREERERAPTTLRVKYGNWR